MYWLRLKNCLSLTIQLGNIASLAMEPETTVDAGFQAVSRFVSARENLQFVHE
jgi:hypothetical protein